MIRALFHRGRHHRRAPLLARPFDERHPRPTVEKIAARIRDEAARKPWTLADLAAIRALPYRQFGPWAGSR